MDVLAIISNHYALQRLIRFSIRQFHHILELKIRNICTSSLSVCIQLPKLEKDWTANPQLLFGTEDRLVVGEQQCRIGSSDRRHIDGWNGGLLVDLAIDQWRVSRDRRDQRESNAPLQHLHTRLGSGALQVCATPNPTPSPLLVPLFVVIVVHNQSEFT